MNARRARSKKRSAGTRRRRKPVVFLIDHCLGRVHVAAEVRAAGYDVELLSDHFAPDTPDQDWLSDAGQRGWVVLTKDRHFRKRSIELRAVILASARVFVLSAAGLPGLAQAQAIGAALPKIVRVCHQHGPLIGSVTASGAVTVFNSRTLKQWFGTQPRVARTTEHDDGSKVP